MKSISLIIIKMKLRNKNCIMKKFIKIQFLIGKYPLYSMKRKTAIEN